MGDTMTVFDRRRVQRHRERAAPRLGDHDFLFREVAERLAERLQDVSRRFAVALDLGCHGGALSRLLAARGDVETLVACDLSPAMATLAGYPAVAADEEILPFADGRFDLIASNLALHWINDLPGALVQVRRALKPDGLFLAAMLGGETLRELRECLLAAEAETTGGASPRVSPFAEIRDAGGLLQRAGFALPVADADRIAVTYPDAFRLMADLRGMGETNAVIESRRGFTRRATLLRTAELYAARHAEPDGRIRATFQVIYLHGWAPHDSQQRPMRPGSATGRLAEALGAAERPAGDKARPD